MGLCYKKPKTTTKKEYKHVVAKLSGKKTQTQHIPMDHLHHLYVKNFSW